MTDYGLGRTIKVLLFLSAILINGKLLAQKSSKKPGKKQGTKVRIQGSSKAEVITFQAENIPFEHRIILQCIFSLRADSVPVILQMDTTLNRVARRAALANLGRDGIIKHTDADEKALNERTDEEGYQGKAGEIVSVGFVECLQKNASSEVVDSMTMETGNDFKNAIRNSPAHYRGLMARTGTNWTQFGYAIVKKEIFVRKYLMCKYSLCLVLGKP